MIKEIKHERLISKINTILNGLELRYKDSLYDTYSYEDKYGRILVFYKEKISKLLYIQTSGIARVFDFDVDEDVLMNELMKFTNTIEYDFF